MPRARHCTLHDDPKMRKNNNAWNWKLKCYDRVCVYDGFSDVTVTVYTDVSDDESIQQIV